MRLPNGYGSVYKLSGNRRKPFIVRKTTGWKIDEGSGKLKQLYATIGYYKTQQEAIKALAEYNDSPYDVDSRKITFTQIYEKWSSRKFKSKISRTAVNGYKAAYKLAESLHDMKFADIKTDHLQSVIDHCTKGHGTLKKIKVLFNQLYKYTLENDIADKDYSRFVKLGEDETESTRRPFTKEEIQLLWDNVGRMDFVDTILIMIYSGLRPGELVTIENANIHLDERYMTGGIKTPAGKNRVIPINKKIHTFIENRIADEQKFLIVNYKQKQMSYDNYYTDKWKKIMEQLKMDHKPHDCRHTFASLMDSAGANKVCIKRIMGHASSDITDKVYTHKDIAELIEAVDMI